MQRKAVIVTTRVFELFPNFHRGVVVASDIHVAEDNPLLARMLTEAQERCAIRLREDVQPAELGLWEEAYHRFNCNPRKFRPAVCQLADRIRQNSRPLPFINEAVCIFNITSLASLRPCGGDDADRIAGDLVLDMAKGDESFEPLGRPGVVERPEPGEIVYVDSISKSVMCRRMNWKNGHPTRITKNTKNLLINVDGLNDPAETRRATEKLASLLKEICGGSVEVGFLDTHSPCIDVTFPETMDRMNPSPV